jgi:hypothetical protein
MTFEYNNHAVRDEGWRYIRYANGDEELYDETRDPYEWTNLAGDSSQTARKSGMARQLPTKMAADLGNKRRSSDGPRECD